MDLSNQKILFNHKFNYYELREYGIPEPVYFAMPTLAFHVCINYINVKHNFIQETILYLKRNGVPEQDIVEQLCLDERLVDIIIENYEKSKNKNSNENECIIETEEKTEDFYIFYDLITNEFIDGYMKPSQYSKCINKISIVDIKDKKKTYLYRENIGDSSYTKIHLLGLNDNVFTKRITPLQENIISCYKEENIFDKGSYLNPRYLNEVESVWLVLPYSVTKHNTNEFSIINPFKDRLIYSTYFNNIVKMVATDQYSKDDIREYQNEVNNYLVRQQNDRMIIKSDKEKVAYEGLARKYKSYGYFTNNKNSYFEIQLVKMQSTYDIVEKNNSKKDCSEHIRKLYEFANNVLEQLFIICYEPFIYKLPDQLKNDKFFDAIGLEKTFEGEKMVIGRYFDNIKTSYDLTPILTGCTTEKVAKCIKKKNILHEESFKPSLKDLFAINVLNCYYNNESKFNNLFKNEIPYFMEVILHIVATRQEVRHSFENETNEVIKDIIDTVYKIIDTVLEVNENNETIELSDEDQNDYSTFMLNYNDLDNITIKLQESCNQLLRDIFNTSELYYSDCVVAFENTATIVLDYIMGKINSIGLLKECLNKIPDDEVEAKIVLMEKLSDLNINIDLDNITIDIVSAKNCILKNYDFKKASTLIFFTPLLLLEFDNIAFRTLYEQLGSEYFNDAIKSINDRGHDSQSTDWKHIKIINDKYINYCRILTLFEREEL